MDRPFVDGHPRRDPARPRALIAVFLGRPSAAGPAPEKPAQPAQQRRRRPGRGRG
ncbi:MAG TPA: hypothetical protein VMU20_22260 [Candidatus Dormibacteraeota bacterium]|nr:hypothetical protein [Candidatus Dormibacteraeota bacterium]